MDTICDGVIAIRDQLTIRPGFSFEQFQRTKFYKNQDDTRIIYLDGPQRIDDRNYLVSLFFRNGTIYMVSFLCCDEEFSERDEPKRKRLHDAILDELGLRPQERFPWGTISSDYDARSNLSSINIVYWDASVGKRT